MISGCAIASAILLAHIASQVITHSAARNLSQWTPMLSILLTVWAVGAVAHWLQARLGQHGASAVIADLG
ncbi:MAG: thiol reductant ABC exporter subunit CydD, partial [Mycobacterium sp.]